MSNSLGMFHTSTTLLELEVTMRIFKKIAAGGISTVPEEVVDSLRSF
uniref:Uncharacterized protein n=1 Tax=Anguilla anguilla TaxID=7936 RepID=A0A0E9TK36_ANGAN